MKTKPSISALSQSAKPPYSTDEERWAAVEARDARADGCFVYAVRTTGIFCRPSCSSRRPARKNVVFHATPEAAEQDGFRACKRCRPEESGEPRRKTELAERVCRMIEEAETEPSLGALAAAVGLSSFHLQRLFKRSVGVSPKQYARSLRMERMRRTLPGRGSVTEAVYEAGYGSAGRFYEESNSLLGMKPSAYRKGGEGERLRFGIGASSLGAILVAATGKGVCWIALGDDPDGLMAELKQAFPKAELIGGDREFETWMARVIGFVEAPAEGLPLPLDVRGTVFQRKVWKALRAIPLGSTLTYAGLAKKLGFPKGARAVGAACRTNQVALAIPCHRVVRSDGALAGYRWGLERKRVLLAREGSHCAR